MRAESAGLSWPLPADLSDTALEARLFPTVPVNREVPLPDFVSMHAELLRHKHLTLELLWQEYKRNFPEGYQYSWYCELYRRWASKLDIVLRQEYRAGEKMFVDHAGPTVPIVDPDTGVIQAASIFVAVLGASNYTFCEAVWKRDLPSWIGSHTPIRELLTRANQRNFRKLNTTRQKLFEEIDRPALKALPASPFEFADWKGARVHPDYHVEVDHHYYSVPYKYAGENVEVRYSEKTVEILLNGSRIACWLLAFPLLSPLARPVTIGVRVKAIYPDAACI